MPLLRPVCFHSGQIYVHVTFFRKKSYVLALNSGTRTLVMEVGVRLRAAMR